MHNSRNQRFYSKYSHHTWVFQQNSRFIQCCPNFLTVITIITLFALDPFLEDDSAITKRFLLDKENSRKDLHSLFDIPKIEILLSFSQTQENVMKKYIFPGVGVPHPC